MNFYVAEGGLENDYFVYKRGVYLLNMGELLNKLFSNCVTETSESNRNVEFEVGNDRLGLGVTVGTGQYLSSP